jgi:signal transduction histidine kinase
MNTSSDEKFVLCIRNDACEDLALRKVYQVLPDKKAGKDGYMRVIDESGEDYLYPESFFVPIRLPQAAQRCIAAVA